MAQEYLVDFLKDFLDEFLQKNLDTLMLERYGISRAIPEQISGEIIWEILERIFEGISGKRSEPLDEFLKKSLVEFQ